METTMFLASLWGPVLLAVGLGIFISRPYYLKIYRDLEKEVFATLIFGLAAIAAGAAQISIHNSWETLPQIFISLLGWGLLLKGAAFAIIPRVADKGGEWSAKANVLPAAGVLMLLIGGYLTWFAYLM